MNKDIFLRVISHPATISTQDMEALEEVVENFPYCQLAHILIAKASHDQSSMLAMQKLRKSAAYAYNRDVLKKLILDRSEAGGSRQVAGSTFAEPTSQPVQATQAVATEEIPLVFEMPTSREDQLLHELEDRHGEQLPEEDQKILEKRRQIEIINNFIKSEPRIPTLRADEAPLPDRDLSEKSTSLTTKVVSESLAKILVKQGKVEKAIEIYQELICKYPEKKAYFAEKIEQLNAQS